MTLKKIMIVPLVLISLCLQAQTDTAYHLSKATLFEKSRHQKKVALTCVIIGGAAYVVGIVGILASNRWVEAAISGVDGTTKTFIIIGYAGAAAALAAIPFSIAARRNRKKAGSMTSVMLKMENASALSGFGIQNCSYPSLGLNINF
ncbi:MAG: hypothetical protein J0I84_03115 [Terrimonas sp.]|nr:hypothetical protein [Terrimonas sp.]OJY93853.1 MAG: hypothetical protein BGP13_00990 [Sphingobacteriales bacterium 40-81]